MRSCTSIIYVKCTLYNELWLWYIELTPYGWQTHTHAPICEADKRSVDEKMRFCISCRIDRAFGSVDKATYDGRPYYTAWHPCTFCYAPKRFQYFVFLPRNSNSRLSHVFSLHYCCTPKTSHSSQACTVVWHHIIDGKMASTEFSRDKLMFVYSYPISLYFVRQTRYWNLLKAGSAISKYFVYRDQRMANKSNGYKAVVTRYLVQLNFLKLLF